MAEPHLAIQGLPLPTWAGLDFPAYDEGGFDFEHGHGEGKYPYVRGASHEPTGMLPEKIAFTLYFLNTARAGKPGQLAFPDLWNLWWKELQDGRPRDMVHPLLGTLSVVVKGGSVKLSAASTSGIVANIRWEPTILDPEKAIQLSTVTANVTAMATAADLALADLDVEMPSGSPFASILAAIQAVQNVGNTIRDTAFDAQLQIATARNIVDQLIQTADALRVDHFGQQLTDILIQLWGALTDMAAKAPIQPSRATRAVVLDSDSTLDAFAAARKNELPDIIDLNVDALATPTVPKGTMLRYYA